MNDSVEQAVNSIQEHLRQQDEKYYCELIDMFEVAAACKIKFLIEDVDMEVKCISRTLIELKAINYNLDVILMKQNDLHCKYDAKTKELGIIICQ